MTEHWDKSNGNQLVSGVISGNSLVIYISQPERDNIVSLQIFCSWNDILTRLQLL